MTVAGRLYGRANWLCGEAFYVRWQACRLSAACTPMVASPAIIVWWTPPWIIRSRRWRVCERRRVVSVRVAIGVGTIRRISPAIIGRPSKIWWGVDVTLQTVRLRGWCLTIPYLGRGTTVRLNALRIQGKMIV
jgi:hypothetical protein